MKFVYAGIQNPVAVVFGFYFKRSSMKERRQGCLPEQTAQRTGYQERQTIDASSAITHRTRERYVIRKVKHETKHAYIYPGTGMHVHYHSLLNTWYFVYSLLWYLYLLCIIT